MTGTKDRITENITTVTALLVIGVSIIGFGLGFPYTWVLFVVGLFVLVPLIGLLTGADDWRKWDPLSDEFWEDIFGEESTEDEPRTVEKEVTKEDALLTLRNRYARGELTDEQFERKLELLLETESLENVEERFGRQSQSERIPEFER